MSGEEPNSWASPGAAEFDFRSDVVTTPTLSMLTAIQRSSLGDDVWKEDKTTLDLEAFVAELTGHEDGLLVMSGTMGNQVSMRTHLGGPPHSILCDHRAHVSLWEAGGAASLSNAYIKTVVPANGHHLSLEDVKKHAMLWDDVHVCPTKVISLENTCNGVITPLEECQKISAWAKEHDILMHLDGARLWEAIVAGGGSLKDYSACFDSVSLDFSKGLGAPIGGIIVGNKKFIHRARWIRKMLGGGTRQAGIISAPARVSVEETFLGGKLKAGHQRAKSLGEFWKSLGGKFEEPVETNMVWLDLQSIGLTEEEFVEVSKDESKNYGIKVSGARLVVHYQISDDALARLQRFLEDVIKGNKI